jgi:hypothetical protein
MALWSFPAGELDNILGAGDGDGTDESGFRWARSKLLQTAKGNLRPDRAAYLIEFVRFAGLPQTREIDGPDLVLAEAFAPNQAVMLWGAATHEECVARQKEGWGSARWRAEDRMAWWAVTVGGDAPAHLPTWSADPSLRARR